MEKLPQQPKTTEETRRGRIGRLARRGALIAMTALGFAGGAKAQTSESKPLTRPLHEAPAEEVADPATLGNVDNPLPPKSIFDLTLEYKINQWQQEHPEAPLTEEIRQQLTAEVIHELQEGGQEPHSPEEGPAS